jgi:hypothetical protein
MPMQMRHEMCNRSKMHESDGRPRTTPEHWLIDREPHTLRNIFRGTCRDTLARRFVPGSTVNPWGLGHYEPSLKPESRRESGDILASSCARHRRRRRCAEEHAAAARFARPSCVRRGQRQGRPDACAVASAGRHHRGHAHAGAEWHRCGPLLSVPRTTGKDSGNRAQRDCRRYRWRGCLRRDVVQTLYLGRFACGRAFRSCPTAQLISLPESHGPVSRDALPGSSPIF